MTLKRSSLVLFTSSLLAALAACGSDSSEDYFFPTAGASGMSGTAGDAGAGGSGGDSSSGGDSGASAGGCVRLAECCARITTEQKNSCSIIASQNNGTPNGDETCDLLYPSYESLCPEAPVGGSGGEGGTAGSAGIGGSGGSGGSVAGNGGSGGSAAGNGGSGGSVAGNGGSGGSGACNSGPNDDFDGDGWTPAQGDCNDCDKDVNPGAVDILNYVLDAEGNPTSTLLKTQIDEDCSGAALQPGEQISCDMGLGPVIGDPFDAARALGLCNIGVEENPANPKARTWGVIDAKFSSISGGFLNTPLPDQAKPDISFGILPDFGTGTQVREGERLFALSSGQARTPSQPGFTSSSACSQDRGYSSTYPSGFPKNGTCGSTGTPHDGVALDLKIRVPTNANSAKFNFRFFSCEYPGWVCQSYNDVFAVLMAPSPLEDGDPMNDATNSSADIAFETTANGKKNVIGVNNQSFFTACKPGSASGYINCQGSAELHGSGFENNGASAWLGSQVPVPAGSVIYLRIAIWDSADGLWDSTAVIDNFQWSTAKGTTGTVIDTSTP